MESYRYQGEGGEDVIKGFEPWDRLQLSRFGYTTPGDAIGKMTQQGANVVFDDQDQRITFENMRLSDMSRVMFNLS